MQSDKLKGLAEELVSFINTMRSHFAEDLAGADFATCISYGECVGMLHNAANMLGRDIAKMQRTEAATYKPGVMLTYEGWEQLLSLHAKLLDSASDASPRPHAMADRLHAIMNTGLPWVGEIRSNAEVYPHQR